MDQMAMGVRVVVVSDNDAETLYDCLDEVANQCSGCAEVVVVDRNSSDGSPDVAIAHRVVNRVMVVAPGTLQRVVDVASRDARQLLILRADTRPAPGWFEAACRTLDHCAVVLGPDRQWGNMAIDVSRLDSVKAFETTEAVEEVLRRTNAAGAPSGFAEDMSIVPAARSPRQPASLPSSAPPSVDAPRDAGLFTVVVCTRDRPLHLERCLRSLARLDDDNHEIVVVDNHEHPTVDPHIVPAKARVVHEPRRGLDFARNRGIAEAKGSVVAYIDDDCEADPHWVTALRVALADPHVGFATGRVRPATLAEPTQRFCEVYFTFDRGAVRRRFTPWDDRPWYPLWTGPLGTGCNMAIRRAELVGIGGFDELLDVGTSIGGGGDLDLYARLIDRGVIAEYAPDALVWHHHRDNMTDLLKQFRGYGQATGAYLTKAVLERPGQRLAAVRYFGKRLTKRLRVAREVRRGNSLLPWSLLVADARGQFTGPFLYLRARWAARRG